MKSVEKCTRHFTISQILLHCFVIFIFEFTKFHKIAIICRHLSQARKASDNRNNGTHEYFSFVYNARCMLWHTTD